MQLEQVPNIVKLQSRHIFKHDHDQHQISRFVSLQAPRTIIYEKHAHYMACKALISH